MPSDTHSDSHSDSHKRGPQWPGIDIKAARATWSVALTLLALAAVYAIRGTLTVFAVALLFAYLLYPLVDWVARRFSPKHRTPALGLSYLLVLGALGAAAIGIGSPVVAETKELIEHPPDVAGFFSQLQLAHPALAPAIEAVQGHIRQQFAEIVSAAPRYGLRVLAASANLIDLVVIPILAFFMLKDGAHLSAAFLALFPAGSSRAEAKRAVAEIHSVLLSYMRSLLLLCCIVLTVFSAVLSAMGVPDALLLASIAFVCEFVPLLGPLTAAIVILSVAALSGYSHVGWLVVFLGVFRLSQDYVVSPKLMGHEVELHPMVVIFGVFGGAEIGGVAGVFLSIPLLALGGLVLGRLREGAK